MKFFVVVAVYVLAAVIDTCWTSPLSGASSSFQNYGYGGSGSFGMVGPTPQTAKQTVCGQVTKSRIVGGSEARPHQYPWQVGIFMDESYFCGGSIISDEYILTAAHCADGFSYFEVVIGAHEVKDQSTYHHGTDSQPYAYPEFNTQPEQEEIKFNAIEFNDYIGPAIPFESYAEDGTFPLEPKIVQSIHPNDIKIHPNYNPKTGDNDMALIRLPSRISTLTSVITPVCLPSSITDTSAVGTVLTTSASNGFSYLPQPVGGGSTVSLSPVDSNGNYKVMGIGSEPVAKHLPWILGTINNVTG